MISLGLFEGQRIELIDGEILEMSPQEALHFATLAKLQKVLESAFGPSCWVRAQGPLALGASSEPEPDIAVVAGSIDDYSDHPTSAVLVAEVSYSSLAFDRTDKASLYASTGIGEYWIVNLIDRQLEVHRTPERAATARFGFKYRDTQIVAPGDTISPLSLPGSSVSVSDFLA